MICVFKRASAASDDGRKRLRSEFGTGSDYASSFTGVQVNSEGHDFVLSPPNGPLPSQHRDPHMSVAYDEQPLVYSGPSGAGFGAAMGPPHFSLDWGGEPCDHLHELLPESVGSWSEANFPRQPGLPELSYFDKEKNYIVFAGSRTNSQRICDRLATFLGPHPLKTLLVNEASHRLSQSENTPMHHWGIVWDLVFQSVSEGVYNYPQCRQAVAEASDFYRNGSCPEGYATACNTMIRSLIVTTDDIFKQAIEHAANPQGFGVYGLTPAGSDDLIIQGISLNDVMTNFGARHVGDMIQEMAAQYVAANAGVDNTQLSDYIFHCMLRCVYPQVTLPMAISFRAELIQAKDQAHNYEDVQQNLVKRCFSKMDSILRRVMTSLKRYGQPAAVVEDEHELFTADILTAATRVIKDKQGSLKMKLRGFQSLSPNTVLKKIREITDFWKDSTDREITTALIKKAKAASKLKSGRSSKLKTFVRALVDLGRAMLSEPQNFKPSWTADFKALEECFPKPGEK